MRTSKEKELDVINRYINNESIRSIYKNTGICEKTINNILQRNNINSSRTSEIHKRNIDSGINVNPNIFKNHSSDIAYYCGILMADGSLSNTDGISLDMTDKETVYSFSKLLGLREDRVRLKNSSNINHKQVYRVALSRPPFKEDLKQWGIIERKSYNFIEPNIPIDILKDYLRGWFDGDGCFYYKGNKNNALIQLTGNNKAMSYYKKSLEKLDGSIMMKLYKDNSILRLYGKNIIKFYELLNGYPRMERKWNKIEKYIND